MSALAIEPNPWKRGDGVGPIRSLRLNARFWGWIVGGLLVVGAAALFVALTNMRPGYDAFGWLDWGRQALHGNLDTNAAPSWKPLTFLFTLPYAVAGGGQVTLWMITAVGAAFAAPVFAARIAHRLVAGGRRGRSHAAIAAGALAAVGTLGMADYWHQILIANSDPMVVALCLAAIDAHLCGRRRLAFVVLLAAALGRPEAWPFLLGYSAWLGRTDRPMRVPIALGLISVPALWFGIPALSSKTWFQAGRVAMRPNLALTHDQVWGTARLLIRVGIAPLWVAAAGAAVWALVRRRVWMLTLTGCALVWVAIETAFILHGWPAEGRYLMPAAAVLMVLGAVGVGRLFEPTPGASLRLRSAGAAVGLGLCIALVGILQSRASTAEHWILVGQDKAIQVSQLQDVIRDVGGPGRILACGQPTTLVGLQSEVAYELGMNVGFVGHRPGKAIRRDRQIVLLKPHDGTWLLRPFDVPLSAGAGCAALGAGQAPAHQL